LTYWPWLPVHAPGSAALAVPADPPLGAGVGSTTGAGVGTSVGVAPLPPTAGASGVGVGATPPLLPPDSAVGVNALTGLPPPLPGWGVVVVVDWGAAIGAGVGDGPLVGC